MVQYKNDKQIVEVASSDDSASANTSDELEAGSSCASPTKSERGYEPQLRRLNDMYDAHGALQPSGARDAQPGGSVPADEPGERQLLGASCGHATQAAALDRSAQLSHSHVAQCASGKCYLNAASGGPVENCCSPVTKNSRRRQQAQSAADLANGADSLLADFSNLRLHARASRSRKHNRRKRQEMQRQEVTVHPQALVVLHTETTGKQGDELGTDESQTARIAYLLYDLTRNEVHMEGQKLVRPNKEDEPMTEECSNITGLSPQVLATAKSLEDVLTELDGLLTLRGLNVISDQDPIANGRLSDNRTQNEHSPEADEKPMDINGTNHDVQNAQEHASSAPHLVPYNYVIVTDGPAPLRMVLHSEANSKNIAMKPFWYRYFDIRKEFRRCFKTPADNALNISRMLEMKDLPKSDAPIYGQRVCNDIATIIAELIKQGHNFIHPEVIKSFLEPGICYKNEYVDDDCVVRARGLPWQSTDQDVAKFFCGLNIEKGGVALCLTKQGRRNGEALVRFESREFRDLAVRRHKHHLKQRYIEVYRAGGRDFVNVAAGRTDEGHVFLQKLSAPDQCIVRMRGLPYTCTAEQILNFFSSGDGNRCEVQFGEDGVLFVHHPDGRATGDAFVLFENELEATKALAKHKESIGNRYIELFRSTMAEVQQVLNQCHETAKPSANGATTMPSTTNIFGASTPQRSCLQLRGLPPGSTVADILSFLEEQNAKNIALQGVHLVYNPQGLPVGEAFIQMNSEVAAKSAALAKNSKTLRKHTIEVRQCYPEEMNLLMPNVGLLPTPSVPLIDPAAALQAQLFAACNNPSLATGLVSRPSAFIPSSTLSPRAPVTAGTPMNVALANVSPDSSMNSASTADLSGIEHHHHHQQVAAMVANGQQPQINDQTVLPTGPNVAALAAAMQMQAPLFYWYPSPPISPQQLPFNPSITPYYMTGLAAPQSTIVLRSVPVGITAQDLLHFFDGIYDNTPDIQMAVGVDGRPSGDIYVTFATRGEAERAVAERNFKFLGNKPIEIVF